MKDCIFCQIASGEIPADKIYEDDKTIAFLDIKPVNPGHVLVVTKEHYLDLISTPDELLEAIIVIAKKIGKKILETEIGEAITFTFNNGRVAGQVVDHVHLHIMPRLSNDGYELWQGKEYSKGAAEKIVEKLTIDQC